MNEACREIRPLLSSYMDNELTAAEVRAVQAHVVGCSECAAILAEYRELRSLVRSLPQPVPPAQLQRAVYDRATPGYRRRSLVWDLGQRGLTYASLIAVCVAVLFVSSLLLRGIGQGPLADHTAPIIVGYQPNPETDYWSLSQPVRITFSKPMDEASVQAALRLTTDPPLGEAEQTRILQTVRWEGTTLVLGNGDLFHPETIYSITFAPNVAQDRLGTPLRAPDPDAYRFRTITAVTAATSPLPGTATLPSPVPTRTVSLITEVTPAAATTPPATPTLPGITAPAAILPPATPTSIPAVPPALTSTPVQAAPPEATVVPTAPAATTTTLATVAPAATASPTTPATPPTATAVRSTATALPPTATTVAPTATLPLPFPVSGGIGQLYGQNTELRASLGQPLGAAARISSAYQLFQHGLMFWRGDTQTIYVLFYNQPNWVAFADRWTEGMAPGGGPAPEAGVYLPQRGFGKIWREQPSLQQRLGYALAADQVSGELLAQPFDHGLIVSGNVGGAPTIYVLYQPGTYERYADPTR